MKRVLILVEGQTEETFVRDVLSGHLVDHGKVMTPTLVVTKRVKDGPNFKGGITSWAKVYSDLSRLLRDSNVAAVTTMLDYYGLPSDFPGMTTRPRGTPTERVTHVEDAIANVVGDARFIPYLSLHEFEALVFASLGAAGWVFDDDQRVLSALRAHAQASGGPESINEDPTTAPSRRIADVFPRYDKVLQGPMAAGAGELDELRHQCPHFHDWLLRLESL